jgi:hypothetical protein
MNLVLMDDSTRVLDRLAPSLPFPSLHHRLVADRPPPAEQRDQAFVHFEAVFGSSIALSKSWRVARGTVGIIVPSLHPTGQAGRRRLEQGTAGAALPSVLLFVPAHPALLDPTSAMREDVAFEANGWRRCQRK